MGLLPENVMTKRYIVVYLTYRTYRTLAVFRADFTGFLGVSRCDKVWWSEEGGKPLARKNERGLNGIPYYRTFRCDNFEKRCDNPYCGNKVKKAVDIFGKDGGKHSCLIDCLQWIGQFKLLFTSADNVV